MIHFFCKALTSVANRINLRKFDILVFLFIILLVDYMSDIDRLLFCDSIFHDSDDIIESDFLFIIYSFK